MNFKAKIFAYFVGLILIVIFIAVPRGGTNLSLNAALGSNGQPVVTLAPDENNLLPTQSQVENRFGSIFRESFQKIDYGFVVFYYLQVQTDLSGWQQTAKQGSIMLKAELPGEVTSITQGNLKGHSVFWQIEAGQKYDIGAQSRVIRWWLIIVSVLVLAFILYFVGLRFILARRRK